MGRSGHMPKGDWTLGLFIETFPATIDTVAWVLLLMFELETGPESQYDGGYQTNLADCRVLCYGLILSAFAGYTEKLSRSIAHHRLATEFCRDVNSTSNCDVAWTTLRGR